MSLFSDWTLAKLDRRFQLIPVRSSTEMSDWMANECVVSDFEVQVLDNLRELLMQNAENWNEQELSLHFIGPVFSLVNFTTPHSNLFAARSLSGEFEGESINGIPDGMVAKGFREPEIPYFFLQEYKREIDPNGDPAGQCLAAMLIAQEKNNHSLPLYGCYVVGRSWFFITLKEKTYTLSDSFTATKSADLLQIFKLLRFVKENVCIV